MLKRMLKRMLELRVPESIRWEEASVVLQLAVCRMTWSLISG